MSTAPAERPSSRRSFLDMLLGLGIISWLVSATYPVFRFLKPLPSSGPGGPVRLSPDAVSQVDGQGFAIVRAGSQRLMVFRSDGDKLRAVDARCTHEGCTVQFVAGESIIWCACHNGRFDIDGRVLSGPPPKPLPQFAVKREPGGDIVVGDRV